MNPGYQLEVEKIKEDGFLSISPFVISLSIILLSSSLLMLISYNQKTIYGVSRKWNERKIMERIIDFEIKEHIPDSFNDSSCVCNIDEILKQLNEKYDFTFDYISDSGKLDINFIPKGVLTGNEFCNLFSDIDYDRFISLWKSIPLVSSIDVLSDVCPAEKLNDFFYLGNKVNCNFTDYEKFSNALVELGIPENKCSSIIAELFRNKKSKKGIKNEYEFRILFGIYYENVKDFITYKPTININLADEKILKAVFEYLGISRVSETIKKIMLMRMNKELSDIDFELIFDNKNIEFMKCVFAVKPQSFRIKMNGRCNRAEIVFVDEGDGYICSGGVYWK